MPDPDRLLRTLHQAAAAFRATPGRQGRFVQLADITDVLAAGDLHGNIENFKKILELADLAKQPKRHLVLQEIIHGPYGAWGSTLDLSHRLLDLCAALKCQFPERVHVLLGNHELSQWTDRAIMKHDEDLNQLFRDGIRSSYGDRANEIYAAYEALFTALPLALRTPNRIFLSHSLPGATRLDRWKLASICKDDFTEEDIKLGGCIHAIVWGRDLAQATAGRFLQKVDADLLITGHIPCDNGFMVPNDRQLILDCKDEKARCCLFPADRPLTQAELLAGIARLYPETA